MIVPVASFVETPTGKFPVAAVSFNAIVKGTGKSGSKDEESILIGNVVSVSPAGKVKVPLFRITKLVPSTAVVFVGSIS
ncbi:hypothetical protein D3C86_1250770 [compost metagenome]